MMVVLKRYLSHGRMLKKKTSNVNIITELKNRKGIIKLNRPKALNSLNLHMIRSITETINQWYTQELIDSLIIDSVHPTCFCAGGDIVQVTCKQRGRPDQALLFKEGYELIHTIGHLDMPVISVINGTVMGGGVGLSIHSKYRIATELTVFSMPEVFIGLFPDAGGSWFLPRLRGELGKYLGMTGYRIKGSDTYCTGIATHMCPTASLSDLRNDLESASIHDFDNILEFYHNKFQLHPFSIPKESLRNIDQIFGTSENSEQIFEKLKSLDNEFSRKTLEVISKGCPKSLAITFQLLKMGEKAQSLSECLNNEYSSVLKILMEENLYEGVRALLVDKDLSPKWCPNSLNEADIPKIYFNNEQSLSL